ncbi:MAG: Probable transcription regulator Cj0571 [uncultured Sulfurovum sp.]|uniref:Probable transcription regulator Cj0571 n=1 Tax=uncultured Sulfurovum sp. TaxID=269237 RepID=A0A6S6T907_9BACT|nr:MAG: Probable transcription regulator Cj0571 [uncultured Sulfurovum sp.]
MRISFIEKLSPSKTEPKTFHSHNIEKLKVDNAFHLLQTPFSKIQNQPYRVMVEVSAFASVYFRNKRYLKMQREIEKLDNGATLFEFTLTDDMEIIPLIQKWIPHLKVIEPLRIKEKIEENMQNFMKGV